VGGAEQRARPLDGDRLDLIDVDLALVVALARVALRILVGEDRSGGGQNCVRDVVLRRDEAQTIALPPLLGRDELSDFGINAFEDATHAA
jgi:hypothetical protein